MSWLLGGVYCFVLWLVFAKLRLLKLTLPIAILAASIGPSLIVALLFCAQYFHPYTEALIALQDVDPVIPQMTQPGRVTEVLIKPNTPIKAGDVLFKVDQVPYQNTVSQIESSLAQAQQGIAVAESTVTLVDATVARATADLQLATNERDRYTELLKQNAASQDEFERAVTKFEQASAAMKQANESLAQAKFSVGVSKSEVAVVEARLADAKYDLEQTTVTAPADGFVTNLQLRPGMLVGMGSGAVMSFVRDRLDDKAGVVVATFGEKNYLRIKPGQYAEVALDGYPGEILTGRVLNSIDASGMGQLTASGALPTELVDGKPSTFAVRIKLDDPELRIPAGAQGQAAVYTEDVQIVGIPIMFLIRTKSWLKYVM